MDGSDRNTIRMTRSRSKQLLESADGNRLSNSNTCSESTTEPSQSTSAKTQMKKKQKNDVHSYRQLGSVGKSHQVDQFSKLSLELMCHIAQFLPLLDVMKLESLCRRWREAVTLHLKLLHQLDLCEGELYGWMPAKFTDDTLGAFLGRCNSVTHIYGLHPQKLVRRWCRKSKSLSVPGVIAALQNCPCLLGIEISNIVLLEEVLIYLPNIKILGCFTNRDGAFPIPLGNKMSLVSNYQVVSMNLTGVVVERLPCMGVLEDIYMKCVLFTDPLPFRYFAAPFLKSFVMNNCAGPTNSLKYVPLVTALAAAGQLHRLELIRVPFLGGLFQHVVEDSWRLQGFRQLSTLLLGACKHAMEADLGYLAITAAARLQQLSIQPSLSKDSFFSSLLLAEVEFPSFDSLHLGYVNDFPPPGRYSNEELSYMGLAEVSETPPNITDAGIKTAGQVFSTANKLIINNCPYLHQPSRWHVPGSWSFLQELRIERCHAVSLADFCLFIPALVTLQTLHLRHMFREPPRGCSRVGLSAGTGLGVSSAFVANQAEHNHPLPDDNNNNESDIDDDDNDEDGNAVQELGAGQDDDNNAGDEQRDDDHHMEQLDEQDIDLDPVEVVLEDGLYYLASFNDDQEEAAEHCHNNTPTSSVSKSNGLNDVGASCNSSQESCAVSHNSVKTHINDNTDTVHCSAGASSEAGCSYDSDSIDNPKPGCSQPNSNQEENGAHSSPQGNGKGKSLCGKKKGLVRKQSKNQEELQDRSCQAVSEEIRESTIRTNVSSTGSSDLENDEVRSRSSQTACVCCGRDATRDAIPGLPNQGCTSANSSHDNSCSPESSSRSKGSQMSINKSKKSEGPASNTRASTSTGAKSQAQKMTKSQHKAQLKDQATSTSDPIIDEDFIQELHVTSASLQSIILENVGVSDVILSNCPKLQNLTVRQCRVLNRVLVVTAPLLSCVTVAQCRKINHSLLVKEVCSQPPETDRLIILRPVAGYNVGDMERALLQPSYIDYSTYLLHDYTSNPSEALETRIKVDCWLDILMGITRGILKVDNVRACRKEEHTLQYPWGRNIFRVHGRNMDSSYWQLVTDIPWIRTQTLFSPAMLAKLSSKAVVDGKRGNSTKESFKETFKNYMADIVKHDLAEVRELKQGLFSHSAVVIVNMCDVDRATPVVDKYF